MFVKHFEILGKHFIFSNRSKIGLKELPLWGFTDYIGCYVVLTPFFGITIVK